MAQRLQAVLVACVSLALPALTASQNYGVSSYARSYSQVGGGYQNYVYGIWSTIGGGGQNAVYRAYATVRGGRYNIMFGYGSTISGGYANKIGYSGRQAMWGTCLLYTSDAADE